MKVKLKNSLKMTLLASLIISMPVFSQTTVKWLHLDNDPEMLTLFEEVINDFEKLHPDVNIETQYLENESYKKKLTTLLQSKDKPDIIYSWGAGTLKEQVAAGVIEDITQDFDGEWSNTFYPAAIESFRIDGKQYGAPYVANIVGVYYNKDIFNQVGINASEIKTWDDFLKTVDTLKNAGITPIAAGGGDKWPLHFYWAFLALRLAGEDGFINAMSSEEGFNNPEFIEAARLFQDLAKLEPFQKGYIGSSFSNSSGYFGEGKAAMVLQLNALPDVMKANSGDKIGVPTDKLGWMPFPMVEGGKGNASDVLGGLAGWSITKGASKEAVEFLKFFTNYDNQKKAAERNIYMPTVKGTGDFLTEELDKIGMEYVKTAPYFQVYYDQMLGSKAGAVMNDMAVKLAMGTTTPEEAAKAVQDAWKSSK